MAVVFNRLFNMIITEFQIVYYVLCSGLPIVQVENAPPPLKKALSMNIDFFFSCITMFWLEHSLSVVGKLQM